jgi:hypothetical protein
MGLRLDRFSWIVIAIIALLLVAAVITANITGGQGWGQPTYLDEETPAAAVHNAYVAFLEQDPFRARQYYTEEVLANVDDKDGLGGPFFQDRFFREQSRRLRILEVQFQGDERATVTFSIDHYSGGGLFDTGSTWTMRRTVPVVQEDGHWKIASEEFFY